MVRVFMVYDAEPDPARYEQHVELCRKVEGATFRHGKVFGTPAGEPEFRYYAEFEFPDMDGFEAAARTPELTRTGVDAMSMGVPFRVHFASVE